MWAVLGAVAVALPLGALHLDRRAAAAAPHAPEDVWAFQRRHRLSADEMDVLSRALRRGRRVDEPALRPLAVERAEIELQELRWPRDPRRRRVLAAFGAVLLVGYALAVATDPPDDAFSVLVLLNPVLQVAVLRWRTARLRQALVRNSA